MSERLAPRRAAPYPGSGAIAHVPNELWLDTIRELQQYADARSEALVFWGGAICGGHVVVTGLYILGHHAQGGTVRVTAEESRWLVRELRRRDEKLVAQVHSHPGRAYHSCGDDEHAAAFHEGFLSIVAPDFATKVGAPSDCAVHEYRSGSFHELPEADVCVRMHLHPMTVRRHATEDLTPRRAGWLTMLASSLKQKFIERKRR